MASFTRCTASYHQIIYLEYNYAVSPESKSQDSGSMANQAIDGLLNTYSQAAQQGTKWWMVDLGRRIIFKRAAIYVRDGVCDGVECCK